MSCKPNQSGGEEELKKDRLSELPDEILLSIMSYLSMKEVARNSVLSHRWRNLWLCFPILYFDDFSSMEKIWDDEIKVDEEGSKFVKWVNHVIDHHVGPSIDDFGVTFNLNKHYQSDINKWVAFAFKKQAKKIKLHFFDVNLSLKDDRYTLSAVDLSPYLGPGMKLRCLKLLHLMYVNVDTETLELILNSCTCLEDLFIGDSQSLTSIRTAPGTSFMSLKSLRVLSCYNLKTIDISAPKLESFGCSGTTASMELCIRDIDSLSKMSVDLLCAEDEDKFEFLRSMCVPKLEYLQLSMGLNDSAPIARPFPTALTNLKHLKLICTKSHDQSILGWIPLIEAPPLLQKLTLFFWMSDRLEHYSYPRPEEIGKREGKPLKCLKTLELVGFVGCVLDVEFVTHVFENATMLQEVIVDVHEIWYYSGLSSCTSTNARENAKILQTKVPKGVNFIFKP